MTATAGAAADRPSARSRLRTATAPCHERVDQAFSTAALGEREGYGRFLTAQAAAHLPVEAALTGAGIGAIVPDWPARQRGDAIRADLAELGLPEPAPAGHIDFAAPAAMLGGLYVLEGSRLGGRLLRRSVPPALPTRFLADADPGAWRRLLALLDEQLAAAELQMIAINAATQVFLLFEASGQRFLRTN